MNGRSSIPPLRRLALLLCGALAAVLGSCTKKADPVTATRTFFEQVAAGRTAEAYESATFAFRAQQSLRAFETTVKEQGLSAFSKAQWEAPQIEGRTARIRGEVSDPTTPNSALLVILEQESGVWRIFSIRKPRSAAGLSVNLFGAPPRGGGFTEAVDQPIPDEAAMRRLTRETLLKFNAAVQEKSFAGFHGEVSKAWQKQVSAGDLQRAFQAFINTEVDIGGIRDVEPVFNRPPRITSDGLLLVTGLFPTTPHYVVFTLRFTYELPAWKLFGIDVNLQKPN